MKTKINKGLMIGMLGSLLLSTSVHAAPALPINVPSHIIDTENTPISIRSKHKIINTLDLYRALPMV